MTILQLAKKLDANLVNGVFIVAKRTGSTRVLCNVTDLDIESCVARSISISYYTNRWWLELHCSVELPDGEFQSKILLRVIANTYAEMKSIQTNMIADVWPVANG